MTLSLHDLKESNEFLNSLIDNINSAVFVVDKSLTIKQFNQAMKMLFGKADDTLTGMLCGNALGCAFAVNEKAKCGATSHCLECELRCSVVRALTKKVPTFKQKLIRDFYIHGEPVLKYFEYSTKYVPFEGEEMILIIVDDISESEVQKQKLIEKQKRIDDDLKAAAGIQQSLLPQRLPKSDRVEIAWKFLPCEAIGGDIFNVFRIDANRLGAYILDVSGHGVTSALVTVSVSQSLHPALTSIEEEAVQPDEVCRMLDLEYPLERFGTFFTMFYLVLDVRDGTLTYSNAGHPPGVLLRRDGRVSLLTTGGPLIGLGGLLPFESGREVLESGDRLVLCTDGLLEHRSKDGEFFGQERFCRLMCELRDRPLGGLLSGVLQSAREFGGNAPLKDDLSLLGIEFK